MIKGCQILFLLISRRLKFLIGISESIWISKSQRILSVSFSMTDSDLCRYHLVVWSNFNLLHNSQWIIFLVQSCLVLYSFCASLLYWFTIWLIVLSLTTNFLRLQFCCVLLKILIIIIIVNKDLIQRLEDLELRGRVETIQTAAILRSVRILKRVLQTWGDLLSHKLQGETIG